MLFMFDDVTVSLVHVPL